VTGSGCRCSSITSHLEGHDTAVPVRDPTAVIRNGVRCTGLIVETPCEMCAALNSTAERCLVARLTRVSREKRMPLCRGSHTWVTRSTPRLAARTLPRSLIEQSSRHDPETWRYHGDGPGWAGMTPLPAGDVASIVPLGRWKRLELPARFAARCSVGIAGRTGNMVQQPTATRLLANWLFVHKANVADYNGCAVSCCWPCTTTCSPTSTDPRFGGAFHLALTLYADIRSPGWSEYGTGSWRRPPPRPGVTGPEIR